MAEELEPFVSPGLPVTEDEREELLETLRSGLGRELLTLQEFADRAGLVYAATTRREAVEALSGVALTAPASWQPAPPAVPATVGGRSAPQRRVVSIFGSTTRKGRWRVGPEIHCVSIFGSSSLDFRQATFDEAESVIRVRAFALFGSVEVALPEGIDATLGGMAVFASKSLRLAGVPVVPGTPLVEVEALAIFGSVTVRSRGKAIRDRVIGVLNSLQQPRDPA